MKASLVWSSPKPERTIAAAMRRCYSTKTIEEIEAELEQKGPEYWKFLLTKALQDKSLDVFEHFTMTMTVEGLGEVEMGALVMRYPYLRTTSLNGAWLVSLNARTLVELWDNHQSKSFAEALVSELDGKGICTIFSELAFGARIRAR